MSSNAKQAFVMIRANLFSLPRRISISVSMVFSVALVVCVLAGFLAMARGFETALQSAGSNSLAVVLGGGTNQEAGSDVPASVIRTLSAMTEDIGVTRDTNGMPIFSREIVVAVDAKSNGSEEGLTLALRGMDQSGPSIRDYIALPSGRLFTPGSREIVVGDRLARQVGISIGGTLRLGTVDWTVVGLFSARGSAFESEIWGDLDAVRSAFDRQGQVQSLRLRLSDPTSVSRLQAKLDTIKTSPLHAVIEADLYSAQSARTASLIRLFGWPLALLMAIGATAGALNTMMNSVSDRTVEIATVRALGFSRISAFLGTWVEAIVLAALGVAFGLLASWLAFNGWQASTVGTNGTRMAFQLSATGDVMATAGLLGLAIGILGGALPATVASRLPLTAALRSS
ncbi:putative ABC transport system permease protein [Rhizobium sp. ERR 922]|uniref:ABC transporter permease n=1 Tax=unclassified Rhizobium TaxID=2613769 RepID=UPI0011A383AE|nr:MULTISPECIES: ABC transporter permease [unclassified Rhizobium]TWB53564.1 putative ABC transport system permease protein [Rhizobium sp. ERR 922]TWB95472.1 putative ABC transport system permease protein [Rhizobium sp. ERR 942]